MFVLTTISDLIQIAPHDFRKPSAQAIEDNIGRKYANKVVQNVGLCICFWDLLKASEGLISQGDGMVNVNVEFRLVVFRPFKGEIIHGVILDSSVEGIRVHVDFFSDIWIPAGNLFEGSNFHYRDDGAYWIWETNDQEYVFEQHEPVRLRVESEVWHDHTPQKPNLNEQDAEDAGADRAVPYTIIGSMQDGGLGPIAWWDETADEDGSLEDG